MILHMPGSMVQYSQVNNGTSASIMSSPTIPFRRVYFDTTPSLYYNMSRKRLTKSEMPNILNNSPYTQAV